GIRGRNVTGVQTCALPILTVPTATGCNCICCRVILNSSRKSASSSTTNTVLLLAVFIVNRFICWDGEGNNKASTSPCVLVMQVGLVGLANFTAKKQAKASAILS